MVPYALCAYDFLAQCMYLPSRKAEHRQRLPDIWNGDSGCVDGDRTFASSAFAIYEFVDGDRVPDLCPSELTAYKILKKWRK